MKTSGLILLCLVACILNACDRSKPMPVIPEKKSTFQKVSFTQPQLKSTITLVSETECEVGNSGSIVLAEYSREANKLRIVIRASGSATVNYYDITPEGLRDPKSGNVFLAAGPLLTAQQDKERKEQESLKSLGVTLSAMLKLLDEDKREKVLDTYFHPREAAKAKADGSWTSIVALFENNRAAIRAEWQTAQAACSRGTSPGDIEHGVVFGKLFTLVQTSDKGDNWVFELTPGIRTR